MEYIIREIKESEISILQDFLYEAIFIPEGVKLPEREIIYQPELQVYLTDFGKREDDNCLVAVADGKIVGAVWSRIMEDYGYIDNETPSLAVSLYKEYRGKGIGTELMKRMQQHLKDRGYHRISLSVQKANYAVRMYRKIGFDTIEENEEEYLMVCGL